MVSISEKSGAKTERFDLRVHLREILTVPIEMTCIVCTRASTREKVESSRNSKVAIRSKNGRNIRILLCKNKSLSARQNVQPV